jgi:hypothetical protein
MPPISNTLKSLEKLRENSHLGKHKHFAAADRCRHYNTYLGIPVIITNVLLGSLLFVTLSEQIPKPMKWIGAFLALIAAILSSLQTFFNFQKSFESHRRIANQYLDVARKCEHLIASFQDNLIDLSELSQGMEDLNVVYNKVNNIAEAFPTNNFDLHKARKIQQTKNLELSGTSLDK